MTSFWNKLPRPFYVLAPLANATDAAFRRIIAKYGKPDVMWTEFVSADGLILGGEKAREILLKDLLYTEAERPIIAQLFTARPKVMEKAATLVSELGFDGLDINMGCPDRSIEKQGAGAALMKTPELAVEIIEAAKRGAKGLPVSVKTRLGYNKNEIEKWLPTLYKTEISAITIHARTRKEMSKVPAHWDQVKRVVELRNELSPETLIIGNGDIIDLNDAKDRVEQTGVDGIMLGKAIFGKPHLFSNSQEFENKNDPEVIRKILAIMVEHTKLFEEIFFDHDSDKVSKNFSIMKKHYKAYVHGWDGAKELRVKLMKAQTAKEVESTTKEYLSNIK